MSLRAAIEYLDLLDRVERYECYPGMETDDLMWAVERMFILWPRLTLAEQEVVLTSPGDGDDRAL